jgi:hypothetical protein
MARATSAAPLSTTRNTTNKKPKNAATISQVEMALLPLNPLQPADRARIRSTRSVVHWDSRSIWISPQLDDHESMPRPLLITRRDRREVSRRTQALR